MRTETAIELINHNLIFFPGWHLGAKDHTKRFEGTIILRIDYHTWETGRENAAQNYPQEIDTYAEFPIVVVDMANDVDLYREIICCIMKVWEHETREALRVKGSLWSPFHPHAVDGMKRWVETTPRGDRIMPDLQFGIG